jgi:sulfopyruvate decarboxylase TPP-binding subunit
MTDRRLLPKLRTGCSTFFSGLPCSNLGDLFDRVGEAPEFVTVPAAEDSSRQRSPVGKIGLLIL